MTGAIFTPSGDQLVTAGGDNRVIVWSIPQHRLLRTDLGHSSGPQGLALDPRHGIVYSAALDGSVLAYDLTGEHGYGRVLRVGAPQIDPVPVIATPGSRTALAVAVDGGRVEVFGGSGLAFHRFLYPFPDHRATGGVSFSPDGRELAVAAGWNAAGTAGLPGGELIDVSGDPQRIGAVRGFPHHPNSTFTTPTFTPNGRSIVWSQLYGPDQSHGDLGLTTPAGRRLGALRVLPTGAATLAVSPNSRRLVTIDLDGGLTVYARPGLHPLTSSSALASNGPTALAISPDGRSIAVGDYHGLVHLLDAATLRPIEPAILAASGPVISLSFDGSGQLLAESGTDASTNLIDVPDWRAFDSPLLEPVSFDRSAVSSAFGQDDRLFAVSLGGTATEWPLSTAALVSHACAVAHRQLTRSEWTEFLRGRPYQPQCSDLDARG